MSYYVKRSCCHDKRSCYSGDSVFYVHGNACKTLFNDLETQRLDTLKRSFTVLANQIIVSETFQAFRILTYHISVRKTLSWKPCLVSNVLAFAELANQIPAD